MPIYEYLCQSCGRRFEMLKPKMVKNSREACPDCDGIASQQLSAFGIGSGAKDLPCGTATCPSGANTCAGGSCPLSQR